jgi:NAD(P)-dependent dehydrogenase (short-subunit alcohol dehydrogenase family)
MMKAIVTGHARGLGAALAEQLLVRDIAVLGISRSGNSGLAARFPHTLEQAALDLSDSAALARWLASDTVQRFLSGCSTALLINNAGTVRPVGPAGTQDIEEIAKAIALNVTAPLMLANAFAAAASSASDKRILHISSGAGQSAVPGWGIYCATKAALDQHARATMADRVAGLRISSISPGVVDTDMQAEIRATAPELFPLHEQFASLKRDGALASPQDCACRLIDYLLGPRFGDVPVTHLQEMAG